MPLSNPQQTIFDDPNRFIAVSAGRRFGKTYLSMWMIAREARHPNKRIMYIAPTYGMGKQIIWEDLKEKLTSKRWVRKINESDLSITLVNQTKISIRSADTPDRLRGLSLDLAILDEASYMNPEIFRSVIRPTLSDRQGKAVFISTPSGYNWFYDLWSQAKTLEDWSAYQYTTLEGGQVTPEEVEAAKRDLDKVTFDQEYNAKFENAGHRIYYPFKPETHIGTFTHETPKILKIGLDFNIQPMSAVIGAQIGDHMHIIDEICIPNSNTDEMAQEITNRYPDCRIQVFPDPAGAARKTSAGGKTDHSILQQWGFQVLAKRRHTAVKDRINAVNRMLLDASGQQRLWIDPKCRELIKCISKHQYKEGTMIPEKNGNPDYSHMNDALGYMIDYLYPVRRPEPDYTNEPQIYGHF